MEAWPVRGPAKYASHSIRPNYARVVRIFRDWRGPVVPPIVIAKDGVNAKRGGKLRQRVGHIRQRDGSADEPVPTPSPPVARPLMTKAAKAQESKIAKITRIFFTRVPFVCE